MTAWLCCLMLASPSATSPQRQAPTRTREPPSGSGVQMVARVVGEDEQPVEGARVWFVELSAAFADAPMSELRDVLSYDLASLCRRLGSELVTDTDGRARQTFAGGALALAEKDGRSGVEVF